MTWLIGRSSPLIARRLGVALSHERTLAVHMQMSWKRLTASLSLTFCGGNFASRAQDSESRHDVNSNFQVWLSKRWLTDWLRYLLFHGITKKSSLSRTKKVVDLFVPSFQISRISEDRLRVVLQVEVWRIIVVLSWVIWSKRFYGLLNAAECAWAPLLYAYDFLNTDRDTYELYASTWSLE